MNKFDFIIVGAMKAGTSSLAKCLTQNPTVHVAEKELHIFNTYEFSKVEERISKLKKLNANLIGEKSPSYSVHPKAAENIYRHNPKTKIIWILRDPLKRSYSQYLHRLKNGLEIKPFLEVFYNDVNSDEGKENFYKNIYTRSLYSNQIKAYLEFFSMSQMHFIFFEDFVSNHSDTMQSINNFLELGKFSYNNVITNETKLPRFINFEFISRKLFGKSLIYKILHKLNQSPSKKMPFKFKEKQYELMSFFEEDIKKLNSMGIKANWLK